MLTNVNGVADYKQYQAYDIRKAIRTLSPERRQVLLNTIHLNKTACHLSSQKYDRDVCTQVESLLQKQPKKR